METSLLNSALEYTNLFLFFSFLSNIHHFPEMDATSSAKQRLYGPKPTQHLQTSLRRTGPASPAQPHEEKAEQGPPAPAPAAQPPLRYTSRRHRMALRRCAGSLALRAAAAYLRRQRPHPPPPLALAAPVPTPIRRPLAPHCRHFAAPPGTQVGTHPSSLLPPFISPSLLPRLVTSLRLRARAEIGGGLVLMVSSVP